ncbi:hypothetical protein [Clostridium senegalense]
MADLREWKIERLKAELKELEEQMDGLERVLAQCEEIKKATIENKIMLQQQIFELKKILREEFGVVEF